MVWTATAIAEVRRAPHDVEHQHPEQDPGSRGAGTGAAAWRWSRRSGRYSGRGARSVASAVGTDEWSKTGWYTAPRRSAAAQAAMAPDTGRQTLHGR